MEEIKWRILSWSDDCGVPSECVKERQGENYQREEEAAGRQGQRWGWVVNAEGNRCSQKLKKQA